MNMPMKKIPPFLLFALMAFTGQTQWSDAPPKSAPSARFPFLPASVAPAGGQGPGVTTWTNFDTFSPAGDGKTDESAKLIQALTYCRMINSGLLINPAKTYALLTPIDYTFTGTVAIRSASEGKSAVFYLPDNQPSAVTFSAAAGTLKTTLAKDITQGDQSITLASTTGLRVGDLIMIQSRIDWPIENLTKKGEYNVVEQIDGPVVLVRYPCQDGYSVSEVSAVTSFPPARLYMQDIELNVRKTGNRSVVALSVKNTQNTVLDRVQIKNAQYASSQFYGCYNTEVSRCRFDGANEEGEGYGIATVGGLFYDVHDNRSYGCRKLCDFSSNRTGGPTRYSRAVGNVAVGEGTTNRSRDLFTIQSFCVATHGGAESILIEGNTAINCSQGFQVRGRDVTLNNNRILGRCLTPISLSGGQNHTVTNNTYQSLLTGKPGTGGPPPDYALYPKAVIALSNTLLPDGYLIIQNNTFDFVRNYGIYASNVRQRCLIQQNHFDFNTLGGGEQDPVLVFWDNVTAPLSGLRVRENTYQFANPAGLTDLMYVMRSPAAYPVGPVIDWPTCEVQGLRAADVLTLTASTDESPYQQYIKGLSITKKDDNFSLTGDFDFTLQTATQPMLSGLPTTNTRANQFFTFSVEPTGALHTGKIVGLTGQALFGAQTGAFGQSYTSGTHYFIGLDLQYRTH